MGIPGEVSMSHIIIAKGAKFQTTMQQHHRHYRPPDPPSPAAAATSAFLPAAPTQPV